MNRAGYDFCAAYDRVLRVTGAGSQLALSRALEVSQSSVWDAQRRADGIPAGWMVTLVEKFGVNPSWVKTGQGAQRLSLPLEDVPLEALIAEVVRRGNTRNDLASLRK
jgi:hypothetical protein